METKWAASQKENQNIWKMGGSMKLNFTLFRITMYYKTTIQQQLKKQTRKLEIFKLKSTNATYMDIWLILCF